MASFRKTCSGETIERLKRCEKHVIAMGELPEEFVQAMSQPYYDAEQAALNALLSADAGRAPEE